MEEESFEQFTDRVNCAIAAMQFTTMRLLAVAAFNHGALQEIVDDPAAYGDILTQIGLPAGQARFASLYARQTAEGAAAVQRALE